MQMTRGPGFYSEECNFSDEMTPVLVWQIVERNDSVPYLQEHNDRTAAN